MARKILLADDSVTAQNMGRKILTEAGYEVITVNNGSAALKKIADMTHAKYFHATSAEDLKAVYDVLSRQLVVEVREMDRRAGARR